MPSGSALLVVSGALLLAIVAAIAMIDLQRMIIPNALTIALGICGLGFQIASQETFPWPAIVGAAALAAVCYGVRTIYFGTRGVVGLGLGDVKMAGASAIWLHPANLPVFIFISCASALMSLGFFRHRNLRFQLSGRLPFGPFLGLGLIASWCMENFTNFGLLTH